MVLDGEAEAVGEIAAVLENFVHFDEGAADGRSVGDRIVEHGPRDFGSDDAIAGLREAEILSGEDGAGEDVDHHVEFFVVKGSGLA